MSEQEKFVSECMDILQDTISTLIEYASADDRLALLGKLNECVREMILELDED